MKPSNPRVLTIAGTDPTGGAGIQADLKSIAAAGGYGMSVVTSLVVQNTRGVQSVQTPEPEFLRAQLLAVSEDVDIDAIKIGMLADDASTRVVLDWLEGIDPEIPVVVDPVLVASSGHALAESANGDLLSRATVITPNLSELAQLSGKSEATTRAEASAQAQELASSLSTIVLAKGGHLSDPDRGNSLVDNTGVLSHAVSPAVDTTASHGTGCSLSSAIATRLAVGDDLAEAVRWATDWVHEALTYGEDLQVGADNGPIDHFHRLRRQAAAAHQAPQFVGVPRQWQDPAELAVSTVAAPAGVVKPAGPWTAALWAAAGDALDAFITGGFVPQLGSGALSDERFRFYLAQDSYYLNVYSAVLAGLAAGARSGEERSMWASSVTGAIAEEQAMQARWNVPQVVDPSPATLAYTDFLRAEASSDHVVGVAAVLPCFWVYAQVGADLAEYNHAEHPYHSWLSTYDDPGFQEATAQAVAVTETLLAEATPTQRADAALAFLRACQLEADFFAQAMLIDAL